MDDQMAVVAGCMHPPAALQIDRARGIVTCSLCGEVTADQHFDIDPGFVRTAGTAGGGGPGGAGAGGSKAAAAAGRDYARPMRESTVRHLSVSASQRPTVENARKGMQAIARQLDIPTSQVEVAAGVYKMAIGLNAVVGARTPVLCACLYIVCRRHGTPHMVMDFADTTRDNPHAILHALKTICEVTRTPIPPIDPSLYIARLVVQCRVAADVAREVGVLAVKLLRIMKDDWIHTGRRPLGPCAAALLVAARAYSAELDEARLMEAIRLSSHTVTLRVSEFQSAVAQNDHNVDEYEPSYASLPTAFVRGRTRDSTREFEAKIRKLGKLYYELLEEAKEGFAATHDRRQRWRDFVEINAEIHGNSVDPNDETLELRKLNQQQQLTVLGVPSEHLMAAAAAAAATAAAEEEARREEEAKEEGRKKKKGRKGAKKETIEQQTAEISKTATAKQQQQHAAVPAIYASQIVDDDGAIVRVFGGTPTVEATQSADNTTASAQTAASGAALTSQVKHVQRTKPTQRLVAEYRSILTTNPLVSQLEALASQQQQQQQDDRQSGGTGQKRWAQQKQHQREEDDDENEQKQPLQQQQQPYEVVLDEWWHLDVSDDDEPVTEYVIFDNEEVVQLRRLSEELMPVTQRERQFQRDVTMRYSQVLQRLPGDAAADDDGEKLQAGDHGALGDGAAASSAVAADAMGLLEGGGAPITAAAASAAGGRGGHRQRKRTRRAPISAPAATPDEAIRSGLKRKPGTGNISIENVVAAAGGQPSHLPGPGTGATHGGAAPHHAAVGQHAAAAAAITVEGLMPANPVATTDEDEWLD